MHTIDVTALVPRLMDEFGYPAAGARLVAEDLARSAAEVQDAFCAWWNTGVIPELEVMGYTVHRLIQEHGMQPVAALLTLDWLTREPERALASLRKGHDRVMTRHRR